MQILHNFRVRHFRVRRAAPRQVLRESRTKVTSAGVPFSEGEADTWQTQVCEFLRRLPDEPPAAKKRRLAKATVALPRLATLDILRCWDHGLRVTCGYGLEAFQAEELLKCGAGSDGLVRWPKASNIPADKAPPMLVFMTDQDSKNMCATCFLKFKLCLNVEAMGDPHHRRWNDVLSACGFAGLRTSVVIAQTLHNIGYGPFQGAGFFQDLADAAVDISASLGANDPLLLTLWSGICDDAQLPQAERGESARLAFLSSLPASRPAAVKGPKSSLKRWFAWLHAHRFWSATWTVKLLLIVWISIRKGWSKSLVDFFPDSSPFGPSGAADLGGSGTQTCSAVVSRGASSAASEAAPVGVAESRAPVAGDAQPLASAALVGGAASSSKEADKQTAQNCVQQFRSKSANSLHAVGRMLADPDLKRNCSMVALATEVWGRSHSENVTSMRTPKETCRIFAGWAQWEWLADVKLMLKTASDYAGLSRCGFDVDFGSAAKRGLHRGSSIVKDQDNAFQVYWRLLVGLMRTIRRLVCRLVIIRYFGAYAGRYWIRCLFGCGSPGPHPSASSLRAMPMGPIDMPNGGACCRELGQIV